MGELHVQPTVLPKQAYSKIKHSYFSTVLIPYTKVPIIILKPVVWKKSNFDVLLFSCGYSSVCGCCLPVWWWVGGVPVLLAVVADS